MKKGKFTKILSLLMSLVMVLAMGITAFADGSTNEHTITIKNQNSGHTYEAYQIFKGDIVDGKLTNITFGNGVNGNNLVAALHTADSTTYAENLTAEQLADILVNFEDDSTQLVAFSKIVSQNLNTVAGTTNSSTTVYKEGSTTEVNYYKYDISVTGDGYYFIKDKDSTVAATDAYTKYIMQVINDVTIDAKADAPSIEKWIKEGDNLVKYNNAAIGDTVNFVLKSSVPDMQGYNKYFFVVNDTMSVGLTYDSSKSVVVTIGSDTIASTAYTVTSGTTKVGNKDVDTLEIVFKDFIQYYGKYAKGTEITISYSATLNENAVVGATGNPNTVNLTFSNNPNTTYTGDSENTDKPGSSEPTGKTPDSMTITYVTEIDITKVIANTETPLAGATFKITGENLLNTVIVTFDEFKEDENGTYYELTDGTYTETAPSNEDDADNSKYASTTQKYSVSAKVNTITSSAASAEGSAGYTVTSGADGIVKFTGLKAGTYTITETKAPDGYNALSGDITVTITFAAPTSPAKPTEGTETATWSATYKIGSSATSSTADNTDGKISFNVENKSGATLPKTGGTGVVVLYSIGAMLVLSAAVLLITRRRMSIMK